MNFIKQKYVTLGIILFLITFIGCSRHQEEVIKKSKDLIKVSVRMKWFFNATVTEFLWQRIRAFSKKMG